MLIGRLERMQLTEYLRFVNDRRRFLRVNLWAGIARGLGTAIGFTVLGAVLVVFLQWLVQRNIPLINDFLEDVVRRIAAAK